MADPQLDGPQPVIGRYALHGKLASGSMATVHFGRLLGPAGFSRTVAIKRLHPHFAKDPEFVAMFLDEARLAARIQHPNVVATVDVVAKGDDLFLVMDYVRGESFSRLLRASRVQGIDVPVPVIASIVTGMLYGLHAAHEAKNEHGEPLSVVHRAVSPQNLLVDVDGGVRVIDFGVAKAAARAQVSRGSQMKGRLSYMAPEQLEGRTVDRRTDVFAAGVVLWEALTGRPLFDANDADEVLRMIVSDEIPPPSAVVPSISRELDAVVTKSLQREADRRFQSARDFAVAIEKATPLASPREVGEWVERVAGDILLHREQAVAELESSALVGESSLLQEDSRPAFMKTIDDRTPIPAKAPARAAASADEWDEAPTGVFDAGKAAQLLAARARAPGASSPAASRPPLPVRTKTATGLPPPSSPGLQRPAARKPSSTLLGGVAVHPIRPVQIFNDEEEKTIARDAAPASARTGAPKSSPVAGAAFDDEQETTTVFDSVDDVGATPSKTEAPAPSTSKSMELVIPAHIQALAGVDIGDGRATLPPRTQTPAIAKATVAEDGVATIIIQQPVPEPAPESVQIASIRKRQDIWSNPLALVGLIAVLVGLSATVGLVLGKSRSRAAAIVEREPSSATKESPTPARVEVPPAVPPSPAPAPAPLQVVPAAPPPAEAVVAAEEPRPEGPKASAPTREEATAPAAAPKSEATTRTEAKKTTKSKTTTAWKPPATKAPAPAPASAPSPAPAARPVYEDSLDVNPYASK